MRRDTSKDVETFLTLGVGESATYPLEMYNRLRGLRSTNTRILEARSQGRVYTITSDINNKQVILTRTE